LGRKEFWGLDFMITPHVLVPRPDTEILVEAALNFLDRNGKIPGKVLDLCTGSGAVAIAIKHQRPGLEVYGSDISGPALETARVNAGTLLPKGQEPAFFPGDLFSALDPKASWRAFSVITANPPYVASGDIAGLAPEVRQEPRAALDGGEDGLNIIRRIVKEAPDYLVPGGGLFLEADPRQMPAIAAMLQNRGYGDISVRKDLAGLDRVISACFAADRGAP
jgi:release factor glutamine methyltransferase